MFERFTDRARRVVVLAQEAAREYSQNYIGQEHILWGLAHEGEGIAAKVLEKLGITEEMVNQFLNGLIKTEVPSGHIPFTAEGKKSLEMALREALQLGHNYIGTEHVLLGICRQATNQAIMGFLKDHNIDLSLVRQEIITMLNGYTPTKEDEHKVVEFPLTTEVQQTIQKIKALIAQTDDYGSTTLELEVECFLAGWQHKIPECWTKILKPDPDYDLYLKLKEKFGNE